MWRSLKIVHPEDVGRVGGQVQFFQPGRRAAGDGQPVTTTQRGQEYETRQHLCRPPELHRATRAGDRAAGSAHPHAGRVHRRAARDAARTGGYPGTTGAGLYHLHTLEDAEIRVIAGGVQVTSTGTDGSKQPPSAGQGPCGRVPTLRVVDATAGAPEALRPGPPHRRRRRQETCDPHAREARA
jgi:hypothetical protein